MLAIKLLLLLSHYVVVVIHRAAERHHLLLPLAGVDLRLGLLDGVALGLLLVEEVEALGLELLWGVLALTYVGARRRHVRGQ